MQNQNVKKIEMSSDKNGRRKRQRRKNMIGYYILVIFLALAIGASLSVTLLFNIKEITISGTSIYENHDVISASGISAGDNLVRLSKENARTRILDTMTYIDDVIIKKNFPDKVYMEIIPSVEMACLHYKDETENRDGYVVVSENWRILSLDDKIENQNLVLVKGYFPTKKDMEKAEKGILKEEVEDVVIEEKKQLIPNILNKNKDVALREILEQIKLGNIENIVSIDLTSDYDIILDYNNSIKIMIGNSQDIEYKLKYAYHIITEQLRKNKSGYLIYHESLGYSYVTKEEYEEINQKSENISQYTTTTTTTTIPTVTTVTSATQSSVAGTGITTTVTQSSTTNVTTSVTAVSGSR